MLNSDWPLLLRLGSRMRRKVLTSSCGLLARASVALLLCTIASKAQTSAPTISLQPRDLSLSLGATATLRLSAVGTTPLDFQWYHDDTAVEAATSAALTLTNLESFHAGAYHAVVANDAGAVTSRVAVLNVDPTFSKITTGAIATDGGDASGCAWGDYDEDGFPDLFVGNGGARNFLYRNNGDATFMKLTNAAPALDRCYGGSWGDFDNDGWLDLFAASPSGNILYRNRGDGTFVKVTPFAGTLSASSWSGSWGDYDRDGWLDLFICNGNGNNNVLLRNNANGTFTKITTGRIVLDGGASIGAAWQDYDRDGWPDLYVANNLSDRSFLYRNLGDGTFARITTGRIGTDAQSAIVPDWGDYDNDGWPDLAVGVLGRCLLYRNLADGTFAKQTNGPFVMDQQSSEIVQWIDYDNDGFLDLFSANTGGQNESLYHNQGDGTFTKVTAGSVVNDGGNSAGCAWADYDNNGFLDLFVANWQGSRPNFFYRNNGNSNHWLKVKCVGTASNRDGIGSKVRVQASIRGQETWQLREISGGTGFGQSTLLGHFGLGDASVAGAVRVEWPSGAVQEFDQVPADQVFTVTEPPKWGGARIQGATIELDLLGLAGASYHVESSTNLATWIELGILTNSSRKSVFSAPAPPGANQLFFRAWLP